MRVKAPALCGLLGVLGISLLPAGVHAQSAIAQFIVDSPAALAGSYAAVTYRTPPGKVTSTTPAPQGELFVYDDVDCTAHTVQRAVAGSGAGKVAFLTGGFPATCRYYDDVVRERQSDGAIAVVFGLSNGIWRTAIAHGDSPATVRVPVLYMQVDELSQRIRSAVVGGTRVSVSFAAVPRIAVSSLAASVVPGNTTYPTTSAAANPSPGAAWDYATLDLDRFTTGVQRTFLASGCGGASYSIDGATNRIAVTVTASATYTGVCNRTFLLRDTAGVQIVGYTTLGIGVPYVNDDDMAFVDAGQTATVDVFANDVGDASTKAASRLDLDPTTDAVIDQRVSKAAGTWQVVGSNVQFAPAAGFRGFATIDYAVRGPNGGASNTATIAVGVGARNVVEYHNASLQHYFITADPAECELVKTAWQSVANDGKSYPAWTYEATAFHADPPLGVTCPSGTVPVYRAYNNGAGGDGNHRYSTSAALLQAMTGWAFEGLRMCVPV